MYYLFDNIHKSLLCTLDIFAGRLSPKSKIDGIFYH